MLIKMLATHTGSPDGLTVLTYDEGATYQMPDELAAVFIAEGWAVGHQPSGLTGPLPSHDLPAAEAPKQAKRTPRK